MKKGKAIMRGSVLIGLILLVVLGGCGQPSSPQATAPDAKFYESEPSVKTLGRRQSPETVSKKAFKPFYVFSDKGSRENHYVPSGFMPTGECLRFNDAWKEDCYKGQTCVHINYDVDCSQRGQKWAGIYWLNPANNWGKRRGGFNLTGASKLTFWARGFKGGEQIQEFTIGGVEGDYQDTDTVSIGPVILTDQWREYVIDLRGKDLSYISGGFAWTTSADVNAQECQFLLDEIRFE